MLNRGQRNAGSQAIQSTLNASTVPADRRFGFTSRPIKLVQRNLDRKFPFLLPGQFTRSIFESRFDLVSAHEVATSYRDI